MAVAPTEIRTLARSYTKAAIKTLVGIMRQPKAPPAARVMAANALLDRGWGKAAQTVAVDGEIRQLVEVKLNVVQASHTLPKTELIDAQPNDINDDRCARKAGASIEEHRSLPNELSLLSLLWVTRSLQARRQSPSSASAGSAVNPEAGTPQAYGGTVIHRMAKPPDRLVRLVLESHFLHYCATDCRRWGFYLQ